MGSLLTGEQLYVRRAVISFSGQLTFSGEFSLSVGSYLLQWAVHSFSTLFAVGDLKSQEQPPPGYPAKGLKAPRVANHDIAALMALMDGTLLSMVGPNISRRVALVASS